MHDNPNALPVDYGCHVSTTARVGGMEGITTPPSIEGFYSGDDYVTVIVSHLGTSASMCFPMQWWDRIYRVATDTYLDHVKRVIA